MRSPSREPGKARPHWLSATAAAGACVIAASLVTVTPAVAVETEPTPVVVETEATPVPETAAPEQAAPAEQSPAEQTAPTEDAAPADDVSVAAIDSAIDIYNLGDFHGHLERGVASRNDPGAAVIAGALNQFRAANPDTIFTSTGDSIGGSPFISSAEQDAATLEILNEMGLSVSATGNHEYDRGLADLVGRVTTDSDFPYLAANVYERSTGQPLFDDYLVQTVDGVDVAFVGAVTEELPSLVSPDGIAAIEVRDIVTEVNRVADDLSDGDETNGEADVIVLLAHEGAERATAESITDPSTAFGDVVANASPAIDAIVGSHTHLAYDIDAPVAGTTTTRPVIAGGEYGQNLSHLRITFDSLTGEIGVVTGDLVSLSGAAADAYTPDPEVAALVAEAKRTSDEIGARPLGSISADFLRAVNNPTAEAPRPENRGGESTIGNLVAETQLWATQQAGAGTEIALMNPGGIRADLLFDANPQQSGDADGVVTYGEAAVVQPFANTLVAVDLTGAQLRAVLEQQWQPAEASRPFLKLGTSDSLRYTYDPTAAVGERILDIRVNGELVTDEGVYRTAANSFLAAGGDNFGAFAEGTNRADTGQVDLDATLGYFAQYEVVEPSSAQHAVGVVLNTPEDGVYNLGETVQMNLSSLVFSNGEFPDATTAEVAIDGETIDSGLITRTIVDATDEVGTASLAVVATGTGPTEVRDVEAVVTVPGTDTSVLVTFAAELPVAPVEGGDEGSGDEGFTPGVGSGTGTGAGTGTGTGTAGDLTRTGTETAPWLIAAVLALLAAGGVLVLRARRGVNG